MVLSLPIMNITFKAGMLRADFWYSTNQDTHHLSAMMMRAMYTEMSRSRSSKGLSSPKRACAPIMKAMTKSCIYAEQSCYI
jgi:hypothetical protein